MNHHTVNVVKDIIRIYKGSKPTFQRAKYAHTQCNLKTLSIIIMSEQKIIFKHVKKSLKEVQVEWEIKFWRKNQELPKEICEVVLSEVTVGPRLVPIHFFKVDFVCWLLEKFLSGLELGVSIK